MSDEQSAEEARAGEQQIGGVGIHDIGQRLIDLGQLLIATGAHTENNGLRDRAAQAQDIHRAEVYEDLDREMNAAIRRTLMGLRTFRRDYADWERLTVEYALTRSGFTQRDVATLLGVGLSTVNRWAQHPLTYPED